MPAHDEFRRADLARSLAEKIAASAAALPRVRIMHVCGTHERSVNRFGIRGLLPANVAIVAGPGCPVCVCPISDLLAARRIAKRPGTILTTFGDMLAVPAPEGSLLDARGEGADVRVVYSVADALALARKNPEREVVFFAIGFETTTAPTAAVIASLAEHPVKNFSVIASSRVVPEALEYILSRKELSVDGFILPGHVSVIIGTDVYRFIAERHRVPCAVSGFEPVDVLEGVLSILEQIRTGKPVIHNGYARAVLPGGNEKALGLMARVYESFDATWRGLGVLPGTGLRLREEFAAYDALKKFDIAAEGGAEDHPAGCLCAAVMTGQSESEDCPFFGGRCTPASPVGACMVSDEGTCKIRFEYRGVAP
jgi:hydrogenase expression/formation protein HypD